MPTGRTQLWGDTSEHSLLLHPCWHAALLTWHEASRAVSKKQRSCKTRPRTTHLYHSPRVDHNIRQASRFHGFFPGACHRCAHATFTCTGRILSSLNRHPHNVYTCRTYTRAQLGQTTCTSRISLWRSDMWDLTLQPQPANWAWAVQETGLEPCSSLSDAKPALQHGNRDSFVRTSQAHHMKIPRSNFLEKSICWGLHAPQGNHATFRDHKHGGLET